MYCINGVSSSQICAVPIYTCTFIGFSGLYTKFVCIACSQLEKLRANLLDIKQKHDTAEHDSGAETDHEEEQLNDCIRHHQEILR
jgi:hypothetical protein